MSWLKLNDSFNNLKGQITNFAQEVLAETIPEEKDPLERLNDANIKIDELTNLCTTQDTELITLRKQVLELQQQTQQPITQPHSSNIEASSSKLQDVVSNTTEHISDSWFWEPDNNTSSSSSKNENEFISKSPSGGDLTIIPLDNPLNDNDLIDKLNKRLDEKEQKLKKYGIENALINEKLKQLFNENRELNCNIDELDRQHNVAIEKIITLKNEAQTRCHQLEVEKNHLTETLTKVNDENSLFKRNQLDLSVKNEKIQKELEISQEKLQKQVVSDQSKQFIEAIQVEKSQILNDFTALQENDLILQRNYKELQDKYTELLSKQVDQSKIEQLRVERQQFEQDFIALQDNDLDLQREHHALQAKYKNLLSQQQNEERLRLENNKIVVEIEKQIESLRIEKDKISQDFIALQDDNLELQRDHNKLNEKYTELQSEQPGQQVINTETETLVATLRAEKKQLENEFNGLQEGYKNLQIEFNALKAKYEELSTGQLNEMNKQMEMLCIEKKQVETDFNVLQDNDIILQREHIDLKAKYEASVSQQQANLTAKNEAEKLIKELRVEKDQIQHDFNVLQDDDLELQNKHHKLQESFDELVKKQNAKTDNTEAEKIIAELRVEKDQIQHDFNVLQDDDLELQNKHHKLQESFDELVKKRNAKTENNEAEKIIAELRVEKDQIQHDFNVLLDDDLELQNKHHKLQESFEELVKKQNAKTDNTEAEKIIAELRVEKDQIQHDFNVLQDDDLELQNKHHKLQESFDELVKKRNAKTENNEAEKIIAELRVEKDQIQHDFNVLQDDDLELQIKHHKLQESFDELVKKQNAKTDNTEAEKIIAELRVEKDQIQHDFNVLQDDDLELQNKHHKLHESFDELVKKQNAKTDNTEAEKIIAELRVEKDQIQHDFNVLQDDDLELQNKHDKLQESFDELVKKQNAKTENNEAEMIIAALRVEKNQIQENFTALQKDDMNLQCEHNALKNKFAEILVLLETNDLSVNEYQSKIQQLEKDKINLQNKIDENLILQKQIIDLQSNLNNKSVNELEQQQQNQHQQNLVEIIDFQQIKKLIKDYAKYDGASTDNQRFYLEEFLKMVQEKLTRLERSEERLLAVEMELDFANEDKEKLLHNKKTLEADIENYESECQELMSNNTKILMELDELKNYGKLETIHENSEESVALLEKQLDDCNNLNRNLTDDYRGVKEQLQINEYDKNEMVERIRNLENDVTLKRNKCKDLSRRINVLENDLTNLQFELNEYKSDNDNKLTQIINEKEIIQKHLNDEIVKTTEYYNEIKQLISNNERLNENFNVINQTNEQLLKEKNELISFITKKHEECVTYHTEIQRLNQLLHTEMEQSKQIVTSTTAPLPINCNKCPENNELIKKLQNDAEKMNDQIVFLKEKSDILTNNLLIEQTNQKLLASEKIELIEAKNSLVRDLDRLRQHLLEIEDAHTQETMDLQRLNDEIKVKLASMEQETKYNSTAYTSASIRANQHAETLQAQYTLLTQQRDELLTKLSLAEDKEEKNLAALNNLQCALEQFQRDKERDVEAQTLRLRRALEEEKLKQIKLLNDIKALQEQLADAKNGLLAAARISDQLELSQMTVTTLKDELIQFNEKYTNLEKKYENTTINQADKIDKELIKNLLIGYIITSINNDKIQILKLITSVLDFNVNEIEKVGLNRPVGYTSWINNILTNNQQQNNDAYNKESLAQAFVQFLEKESQPRPVGMPTLLNIGDRSTSSGKTTPNTDLTPGTTITTTDSTTATTLNQQQQQAAVQPILLNENTILPTFNPQRNSSSILKDILNDS